MKFLILIIPSILFGKFSISLIVIFPPESFIFGFTRTLNLPGVWAIIEKKLAILIISCVQIKIILSLLAFFLS